MTTTLNASTAGAGGFIATSDNSGVLALQTAGTTAITVDTSQNVGIGTTSPTAISGYTSLAINNATNGGLIDLKAGGTLYSRWVATSSQANISTEAAIPLVFQTNSAERMRIDSAGKITNTGAAYFNPANGTSTGLQQYSYVSYNDNSSHTLAGFSSMFMVVAITTTSVGQSYIPIFGNAGGGVAYAYNYMNPATAGWTYSSSGINFSFTNAGSSQNTYNFVITGGGASISIQRTSGTTSYSAALYLYITN